MKDVYGMYVGGISKVFFFHERAISLLDKQFWWNSNVQESQSQTAWRASCVGWRNRENKITVGKFFPQIVICNFISSRVEY